MADWSSLPQELLWLISLLLTSSYDIIRFQSVCTTWRAAAVQPRPDPTSSNPIITGLPMCDTVYLAKRTLYLYAHQSRNNNPLWIICLGQDFDSNCMNNLYILFTFGRVKKFPQSFPKSFSFSNLSVLELGEMYTVCTRPMSSDTHFKKKAAVLKGLDDTFVILAIVYLQPHRGLYVYESGVKKWKVIADTDTIGFLDVILVGGEFYAIDDGGRLLNVNHSDLSVRIIVHSPVVDSRQCSRRMFLVECEGNLVLVKMYYYWLRGAYLKKKNVQHFEVFRLDSNAGEWVQVNDLGNMILFVGKKWAFSAPAKDIFAETATYSKGNCIFYEDYRNKTRGVRVFDIETGTINKFDIQTDPSLIFWPPPAWAYIN